MAAPGAWICGIGMVTPVGGSTAQTAASVRAGLSRYQESSVYNKRFEPMTLALVPDQDLPPLNEALAALPDLTARQARMLRLAEPALQEATEPLPAGQSVPLFLAGPGIEAEVRELAREKGDTRRLAQIDELEAKERSRRQAQMDKARRKLGDAEYERMRQRIADGKVDRKRLRNQRGNRDANADGAQRRSQREQHYES